jgi:alpha-1,3-mannosyltransferase
MRIVHVVRQFHPSVGGLENVVKDLATTQIANGHSVRVVTLDRIFNAPGYSQLSEREWIKGIEVVRVPFFGSKRYPIALSAIRHIKDADIVHVHGIDFFFDYLAWTTPIHRRKLVVSTHGGFFHTSFAARLKRLYFATVTRLSLTWYSGVATVSTSDDALFNSIRTHGNRLIENGVDISKFYDAASESPKKKLLALGRLSSNKRLDRVIRFLAALRGLDPEWQLCIAGRPWDVSILQLQTFADNLGLRDAVKIVDMPTAAEIRTIMAECSALISASAYEGFGLTVVEGMSAGLWPILSDIAPFHHLVEKTQVGMTVDFDDPDFAARNFLIEWRRIAANYESVRPGTIRAAEAFQWPHVGAKYEAFYLSALGRDVRTILDVPILVRTSSQAVEMLDRSYRHNASTIVTFANAHTLNTTAADPAVHSILDRSIVFNDGIGLDFASRMLFGKSFPENLNGTDFVPRYLDLTKNRYRIFMVGGKPGVADRAAKRLIQMAPRHNVVGCSHGYLSREQTTALLARIQRSRADIVLVAMGNPNQEAWLSEHLEATGCRIGFGVGGLFDFLAGTVHRAPLWVRSARLEWAFRMMQEPRRLWYRYLLEMPIFLARVVQQWFTGARVSRLSPQ